MVRVMPSSTTSSSPSPSLSSLTKGGDFRVSKLRQDWALHEDHALAERLQNHEIELHYEGNRQRNNQIREDFPTALKEQTAEVTCAKEVRKKEEQRNENMARRMAEELSTNDREQAMYEVTRDKIFARKIQALEMRRHNRQEHKDFSEMVRSYEEMSKRKMTEVTAKRDLSITPPLPVMSDGDVPTESEAIGACSGQGVKLPSTSALSSTAPSDISFHDLKGGIRYNDHQYLVKTAVPATVVDNEPVYANNRPEHYAVSSPYPAESVAVGEATNILVSTTSEQLFSAAGLSQRDLALSKRAELQLEQERRDKELAERLQTQLQADGCSGQAMEAAEIHKRKLEADDHELAKALHAKEKAKLRRAKERSRLKKQYKRDEQDLEREPSSLSNTHAHCQWQPHSEPQDDYPGLDHQFSRHGNKEGAFSKVNESSASLPARKPYFNRGAIETASGLSTSNVSSNKDIHTEPQYENTTSDCRLTMAATTVLEQTGSRLDSESETASRYTSTDIVQSTTRSNEDDNTPVPPYMPMQRSNKTSLMERKINRCKEKEGCNQQ